MYHQANPNPNSHITGQYQYNMGVPPPPYGNKVMPTNKPLGPPTGGGGGMNGNGIKSTTATIAPGNLVMNNTQVIPPPQYNSNHNYSNGSLGILNGGSGGGMTSTNNNNSSNNNINGKIVAPNKPLPQQPNNSRMISDQEKAILQQQQQILMTTKEVKLSNDNHEKEMYENLAELYSIVRVTEYLEKLYIRDDVSPKDYTTACSKLIAQFKTSQSLVKDQIGNVSNFMNEYSLNCKAAYERLVNKGFPATLEHTTHTESNDAAMAKNVAEAVQTFITTMDSIKLKMVAVDNIHPFLSDLMECLNRNTWLPKTFEGKEKIMNWISILNRMKANEELDDDQSRQLLFDLESSYNVFYKAIKN